MYKILVTMNGELKVFKDYKLMFIAYSEEVANLLISLLQANEGK